MLALTEDMTEALYTACVFFSYQIYRLRFFQFAVSKLIALGVGHCYLTVSIESMFQNLLYRWQEAHTQKFFNSCTECRVTLLKFTKMKRKHTKTHITGLNYF
jgi:hypothetical protein